MLLFFQILPLNIDIIILFLVSALTVFFSVPKYIKKFKINNFVVPDRYKRNRPLIPTMGGLAIIGGILVSITVGLFFIKDIQTFLIFYFVVFTYALFGLLDDLVNVGNKLKIIAPFFMALPIALINTDTTLNLIFININLGIIYTLIIAPLFVMVIANLVNIHSGYNGLQCGCSLIIIIFIVIKTFFEYGIDVHLTYIMPLFGGLTAFFFYNKFPSQIFEGNIGSMLIGSGIGGFVILMNNIALFTSFIFIPHIMTFLRRVFIELFKQKFHKFGSIDENNDLVVKDPWQLKFTIPYFYKTTEKQATIYLYCFTICFGVIGLYVF